MGILNEKNVLFEHPLSRAVDCEKVDEENVYPSVF